MTEQNQPENRNINTGGGNYNERIEGNYIQNIFNILGWQKTTPVGNPERPKNQRILLAVVKEEVTSRLRQSLHNAVLINLSKESQPQQVKRPWDAEIKIGLRTAVPLSDNTTILEVFDSEEIAGKLLILGAPGAGKTTTQLELAQELIKRAEEQPEYPVPILFNLSSWKDDRQSFTDWLMAELKSKYGVSTKLGKDWLGNQQLLPLLDGLDELEPQRQELCVHAINQFLASETRPFYLLVCSRSEEYSNYTTQLQLNGAIYLQPLTKNQICDYLTSINSIELWSTINNDLDLLDLVKTPLLISITVLASQEISIEEWQHLNSTADRLQYLLDAYIERMLTRDINSRTYFKNKTPNARKTRMWLVWLTKQMQIESKTEFLIEEMQPNLFKTKFSKIIYNSIVWGVIQMLMFGLIFALIEGLIKGLIPDLITNQLELIKGLIPSLIPKNIEPTPFIGVIYRAIYKLNSALKFGLIYGLQFGLIFGLINGLFGETRKHKLEEIGLITHNNFFNKINIKWLIYGLIGGSIYGVIYGIYGQQSQSIWFSNLLFEPLMYGLIFGLIGGMTGDKIEAIETLKFSYYIFLIWLILAMILGIIYGLIMWQWQLYLVPLVPTVLFLGPIGGLILGMIGGTIFGFNGLEIENKTIPNQGILQSAKNTIKLSVLFFLPSTILIFLLTLIPPTDNVVEALKYSVLSGLYLGLLVGISRSGTPLIKHFTLRLILYCNGYIPWNYARFLDYCTERLFVQRVGGRYRFIHKMLQDHFAQMKFRRP